MINLILGGARSGKSQLAEQKAASTKLAVTYIATAAAGDGEMSHRIQQHQQQRPEGWGLIEEELNLAAAIRSLPETPQCILIDCLTLWVSNWLMQENNDAFNNAKADFLAVLEETPHHIIMVSNETGMGVIPMGSLTRQFVDQSGWLHQSIAKIADNVILSIAGLPMPLKQDGKQCFSI